MELRKGIEILADSPGDGVVIEKKKWYEIQIKMWLNRGEPIVWTQPFGLLDKVRTEDEGRTLFTKVRYDRENLVNGIFYGIEGMKVGGVRKIKVAPHLGYREKGVEGMIPPNALLIAEIKIERELGESLR